MSGESVTSPSSGATIYGGSSAALAELTRGMRKEHTFFSLKYRYISLHDIVEARKQLCFDREVYTKALHYNQKPLWRYCQLQNK